METTSTTTPATKKASGPRPNNSTEAQVHREGPIARAIEYQTARVPSDVFLWTAFGAMGASALLFTKGRRLLANLVGNLVPTILIFGLYDKLVKIAGSDRLSQRRPLFGGGGGAGTHH